MMGYGWDMFLWPLFLVLIAIAIYYLVSSSWRKPHSHYRRPYTQRRNAIEILAERYAKGEITKEQFLSMKKELEQ